MNLAAITAVLLVCAAARPLADALAAPPSRSLQAIRLAAVTYRVPESLLRRRAWCESRYNPRAVNRTSGAAGLFQFLRSTWATTPYAALDPFDAYANALAAAWMESVGRGREWVCR